MLILFVEGVSSMMILNGEAGMVRTPQVKWRDHQVPDANPLRTPAAALLPVPPDGVGVSNPTLLPIYLPAIRIQYGGIWCGDDDPA